MLWSRRFVVEEASSTSDALHGELSSLSSVGFIMMLIWHAQFSIGFGLGLQFVISRRRVTFAASKCALLKNNGQGHYKREEGSASVDASGAYPEGLPATR